VHKNTKSRTTIDVVFLYLIIKGIILSFRFIILQNGNKGHSMKWKMVFLILLVTTFSTPILSQEKIKFTEFNLDNGLHVILHQDNSTPIVAVSVMYHVGSKNEQPDRTGFAHFFEHLMFEGSPNIARGEYMKIVENAGGRLNANTDFDRTYYYEVLPSNQLALGLYLESERMLHLKIDSAGVETQRKVVKEERKQRLDNQPYGKIWETTFKDAYSFSPYRWMPIGSDQYIDKASIDEFRKFYKTYYVPQNAVLTISGDIQTDDAKKLVKKYFSEVPKGTKDIYRPDVKEPLHTKEVIDTAYDNIQLPAIVEAYHIPAVGTKDYYPLRMLTTLLSGGRSSRLYKSLVDEEQKAVYVGAFPAALEDPGLFISLAIANQGVRTNELEKLINQELNKVKNDEISDEDMQKLKNQVETDYVNQDATDEGIAENLAYYFTFYKNTNAINTELDKLMKVTKEDIKRVADKYLTEGNRLVLYYLPGTKGGK
jgi:zinc protease